MSEVVLDKHFEPDQSLLVDGDTEEAAAETEATERTPRSPEAARRVHRRWLERRTIRRDAALDEVERSVVMATAGGALACLAIAGATIVTGRLITIEFYMVLVAFLTGLLFSWIGRYLDVVLAVDLRRSSAVWINLYYIRRSCFWLSAITVVVGVILGLIELYGFTR